ncbi:hypothetical protein [Schaalia sp.]|uniref:hypothetical protein n=1 Tax=Schaalia sp. TaxID=2691890 RepID=UPI003D0CC95B
MSIIYDLTTSIAEEIAGASPEVHVTIDAATIRPALAAGKTVAWVGAPQDITLDAPGGGVADYQIALISPKTANHPEGLDDLAALALTLEPTLGITRLTPDTATPGNGPTYPAMFATFEIRFDTKE